MAVERCGESWIWVILLLVGPNPLEVKYAFQRHFVTHVAKAGEELWCSLIAHDYFKSADAEEEWNRR